MKISEQKTRHRLCLLSVIGIVLLLCLTTADSSARSQEPGMVYASWMKLPSEKLLELGRQSLKRDNDPATALICFTIAADRYWEEDGEKNPETVVRAMNNVGFVSTLYFNDVDRAYEYLMSAEEVAKQYKLDKLLPHIYLNLCNLYMLEEALGMTSGRNAYTVNCLKEAYGSAVRQEEWGLVVTAFNNLLHTAFASGKVGLISDEIKSFESLPLPSDIPLLPLTRLQLEGVKACGEGRYQDAIGSFEAMLDAVDSSDSPERQMTFSLTDLSIVYDSLGDRGKMNELFLRTARLGEEYGVGDITLGAYSQLARQAELADDKDGERKWLLKYYESKDSLRQQSAKTDREKRFALAGLKTAKREMTEMRWQKEIQQLVIVGGVIFLLAVLSFLIVILLKNRELKAKNEQLFNKTLQTILPIDGIEDAPAERIETKPEELPEVASEEGEGRPAPKYRNSTLGEDEKSRIHSKVVNYLRDSERIFEEEFSLAMMCDQIGEKARGVSQVINERFGKTFPSLVNEYRIREACRRMNDPATYGNLTIEAIAADLGFKSRSNFIATFKKQTGLTPSEYISIAKDKHAVNQ